MQLTRWRRPLYVGLTLLGALAWTAYLVVHQHGIAIDAHAYYVGTYRPDTLDDALLYSPAFSQGIEPLRWLGWDGFRTAWRAGEVAVLIALTGPLSLPLVLSNEVALEVLAGNIHLYMAGAIVAGFRWPGLWAFMLLTKITPGIGVLWFAVRREWRSLGIALGATAAIVAVSFVAAPGLWFEWIAVLSGGLRPDAAAPEAMAIAVPLALRLPAALVITVWAARGNHRWALPIAVVLAIPTIWITSLAVLVACVPLRHRGQRVEVRGPELHGRLDDRALHPLVERDHELPVRA